MKFIVKHKWLVVIGWALIGAAALAGCRAIFAPYLTPTPGPTPTATLNLTLQTQVPLFPYDAAVLVYPQPDDRSAYQEVDLNQYTDFFQSYELLRLENTEWTKDPVEIAQRFEAWPPTKAQCQDKTLFFIPAQADSVVFVMISGDCPDDAVPAVKLRIEMHDDNGRWVMDWVGKMWKCSRSDYAFFQDNWHTTICP